MLTNQDKKQIEEIVVDVIQDVLMPAFDTLATKKDLENLVTKDDAKNFATKEDLKHMEEKIDKVLDKVTEQGQRLDDHDKQFKSLSGQVL